jgi:hypothetical protein
MIIHSQHKINCNKIISHFLNGGRYFKHYNKYLIPYYCRDINHTNRIIDGRFTVPMWNVLERHILSQGSTFDYSYFKGDNFVIEMTPTTFHNYHILGAKRIYADGVYACNHTLMPNSILLFPLERHIAEPLIDRQLL